MSTYLKLVITVDDDSESREACGDLLDYLDQYHCPWFVDDTGDDGDVVEVWIETMLDLYYVMRTIERERLVYDLSTANLEGLEIERTDEKRKIEARLAQLKRIEQRAEKARKAEPTE